MYLSYSSTIREQEQRKWTQVEQKQNVMFEYASRAMRTISGQTQRVVGSTARQVAAKEPGVDDQPT
jgi:hypothetical protein